MMESADAGLGPRDSGPFVKSLRDVQVPADIASAVASAGATVGEMLDVLATELGGTAGLPARQEARDLIAAVLSQPRFWPTAHRDELLEPSALVALAEATERLRRRMPFQYAVRRADFRSLTLYVDERVLIPRPETELLVEIVLAQTAGRGVVADVGTGSGAIALALAAEGQYDRVVATDVSSDALAVARYNVRVLPRDRQALMQFRAGSYCAPLSGERVGALVSNPPYIDAAEAPDLPPMVRDWEPSWALFAADGGMAAIAALANEAVGVLLPNGLLALEVDSRRAAEAVALVEGTGAYQQIAIHNDLTGRERFVVARRKEN